jgi:hypothetical protein
VLSSGRNRLVVNDIIMTPASSACRQLPREEKENVTVFVGTKRDRRLASPGTTMYTHPQSVHGLAY